MCTVACMCPTFAASRRGWETCCSCCPRDDIVGRLCCPLDAVSIYSSAEMSTLLRLMPAMLSLRVGGAAANVRCALHSTGAN